MQKISPSLWFNDNAQEAIDFYLTVFKQGKIVNSSYYGENAPLPKGTLLAATFQLEGLEFVAINGGPVFSFTEAISFTINCETQEEVDYYWEKLTADGGKESQCGWLKDKFGLSWQVVPTILNRLIADSDKEKAGRAMQAMMKMKKIDISVLEKAYKGE
ncbi:Glyoxalase superfamily enzyme, possibly 3-demethylubiquinone-9 3-methyltransferase [Chitinophaga terrae (ex Kim and Jung 2007)]|uniref:Glyoxalase superfamily enzyme, possibly 3-demethylubiquinone-9 3-methyltransferase n=1 Tax=Chitinophaga terrae (ex Kim and Jung 2007) TaxID=408074 RepID=A0A1H4ARI0_9BACT|nr:VOC family protein [Chitinophaga terrae (ex Kim and Jung 2007)]MDQ0106721.1 two-component system sensor histidine kinase QseC [Chitinophaga terrae (ex Kim and Jung 2007)]GEP89180.1 putative 3-demethylubiquinone-9 3-methyltransferase [Chitinophaga terrae (ex Kim and Jung 2007)]SEA38489.1 Glyoxalase superfamily enzyme, possibly 3-demethylubiquinone-9 3-methyltransferase [Chitinophaga terrae (ex Kim and Jung 2007)]